MSRTTSENGSIAQGDEYAPSAQLGADIYVEVIAPAIGFTRLLDLESLLLLQQEWDRFDTTLPILDPTRWIVMNADPNTEGNKRTLAAFITYRQSLDKIAVDYQAEIDRKRR